MVLRCTARTDGRLGNCAVVSEDPQPEVARDRADETAALGAEAPVEAYLDGPGAPSGETASEQPTLDEVMEAETELPVDEEDPRRHEPPSRKPAKKTRGRASVPSWDEIMFGGSDSDPG